MPTRTHLVPAKQRACRPTSKRIGVVLDVANDAARHRPDIPRQFIVVPNVCCVRVSLRLIFCSRAPGSPGLQPSPVSPGHFRLAAPPIRLAERVGKILRICGGNGWVPLKFTDSYVEGRVTGSLPLLTHSLSKPTPAPEFRVVSRRVFVSSTPKPVKPQPHRPTTSATAPHAQTSVQSRGRRKNKVCRGRKTTRKYHVRICTR